MLDIITVGIFVVVAAMVFVVAQLARLVASAPKRRRLQEVADSPMAEFLPEDPTDPLRDSLAGQLPAHERGRSELQKELLQAGHYRPTALSNFLAIRNGIMLAILVATGTLAVLIGPEQESLVWRVVLFGLGAMIVGFSLPRALLKMKAKARVDRVTQSLPFALDMITMCLSGGAPFGDALKHVTSEISDSHPDLSDELAIVQQQAELSTLSQALKQFANRMDTPEVIALAALVNQNQSLGTETAQAVRDYSENLRLQWRQSADERANRVSVLALLPLVFLLLPAVFIVLWGPAAMELWDFFRNINEFIPEGSDIGVTPPQLGPPASS